MKLTTPKPLINLSFLAGVVGKNNLFLLYFMIFSIILFNICIWPHLQLAQHWVLVTLGRVFILVLSGSGSLIRE